MSNRFGTIYSLTSFGESHGPALGGVIDGCPAGITIDTDAITAQMARRRPGQSTITTARNEADAVTFLSGILNGITTGTPIGFTIANTNNRSADYAEIAAAFRPGHADYTYYQKYNGHNDIRGGGRSSARETACRVVGGAIAEQVLAKLCPGLSISAYTRSVGPVAMTAPAALYDRSVVDASPVRCPDAAVADELERLILDVKHDGDTIGGVVECVVHRCPVGTGEPVFDKLSARLASAMMSINAAKGFEIGMGFDGTTHRGSEMLDTWVADSADPRGVRTAANHSGGIQGGIANGEDIVFRVAFKPVATLLRDVETVDTCLRPTVLHARGRHDPCVAPRAVPVVEAMTAMVLLDQIMLDRARKV